MRRQTSDEWETGKSEGVLQSLAQINIKFQFGCDNVLQPIASNAPMVVGVVRHWPARSCMARALLPQAPVGNEPDDKPDPQPATSATVRVSASPETSFAGRRSTIFRCNFMQSEVSQR